MSATFESRRTLIHQKGMNLYIILAGIFLVNAFLAEVLGIKIFSLEQTLGYEPLNIRLLGYKISGSYTAGNVLWPFVFIATDVINEYFGKPGVRKISFMTAGLLVYAFLIIWVATLLVPVDFWLEIYQQKTGNPSYDINQAYKFIFQQGLGIIVGSLTAFLLGQLLDAYVFHYVRKATGEKMVWLRATGSTLVSQLLDSFVVLFLAFYVFGPWPFDKVIALGINNYIFKVGAAILLTPLIYLAHYLIDRYLGVQRSKELMEQAERSYEE